MCVYFSELLIKYSAFSFVTSEEFRVQRPPPPPPPTGHVNVILVF